MNRRPMFSGRMLWGLIVLTLGVLWTLDNLGQIDASQVLQWWPLVALGWGLALLYGLTGRPRRVPGLIWTIVGGLSLLRPLGLANFSVFDLWPVLLIVAGGALIFRASRPAGDGEADPIEGGSASTSAVLAGARRKIVTEEFSTGDVNAVMAGVTIDLRASRLKNGRAVLDVFAMWGGVDLLVPPEWRVMGEVTPILGMFQDVTTPPVDAAAPTLVVRGTAFMGGIEVRNDERKPYRVRTKRGEREVHVGPGGVMVAGFGSRVRVRDDGTISVERKAKGETTQEHD